MEHLVRFKSDHMPIFVRMKRHKRKRRRGKKSCKFETCWLLDDECAGVVKEAWGLSSGLICRPEWE